MSNRFKLYNEYQALKYVFNTKHHHGRIARWFTLLSEYDFQICYRAGRDNPCADFLSRPVEQAVIDENQLFEANIKLKKKAKYFLVHDERIFRRI